MEKQTTLPFRINVYTRLFTLQKFSTIHALIRGYTFIYFWGFFFKRPKRKRIKFLNYRDTLHYLWLDYSFLLLRHYGILKCLLNLLFKGSLTKYFSMKAEKYILQIQDSDLRPSYMSIQAYTFILFSKNSTLHVYFRLHVY